MMDEATTKLFDAIKTLNEEMAKEAISSGASIESTLDNFTPLMLAAFYGDIEILNILIENNANINVTNKNGLNALFHASIGIVDPEACITALIKQGIDKNIEDNNGETALMFAIDLLRIDNIKCLIDNGVDPEYVNSKGITALKFAENNLLDTPLKTTIARILETAISKKQLEEKKIKAHQTVKRNKHQASFRRFAINRTNKR